MDFRLLKRFIYRVFLGLLFAVPLVQSSAAQDPANPPTPEPNGRLNVYLDCNRCDSEFIRQEMTYINYVRDRQDADIHLLITTQSTGSGGTEYELSFVGHGVYSETGSTLKYASSGTDTDDMRRRGLIRTIAMGLVPALSQTPLWDKIRVEVDSREDEAPILIVDEWNDWVFRVGTNGSADGQRSRRSWEAGGNFSATRLTDEWKIRVAVNGNYEVREFDFGDRTEAFIFRDGTFSALVAKSLGERWAVGAFAEANTSSFENTNLSMEFAPALEYNLFPYSESSRREFRFTYRMNVRSFEYEEETIFGETAETRLNASLAASFEIQQLWGEVNASLEFSHYLHDFSKNRVDFFTRIEFQLIRGLSFNVFAVVSRTDDQLFLAAEDPSDEEVLLDQIQLATTWEYRMSIGFSYRFGSIFNNVVNSRFGSQRGFGGGGGRRRF